MGDREGLEYLRAKITEALQDGDRAALDDSEIDTDFSWVKIAKREKEKNEEEAKNATPYIIGCGSVLLIGVLLCAAGVIQVITWFTN